MVGALTVLIAILAVFLAYNANNGLPFVPDLPGLGAGPERRHAGARATRSGSAASASALVESIEPAVQDEDGNVSAKLDLKLDKRRRADPGRLDRDRPLALGARAQVPRDQHGQLRRGLPGGRAILPLAAATPEAGRARPGAQHLRRADPRAIQQNLLEFGDALAGRGPASTRRSGRLRRRARGAAAGDAQPRLAADATSRGSSTRSARTAAEVAPVAEMQAQMFVSLDTTFGALADVARPFIQESISEGPPTEDDGDPDAAADPAASSPTSPASSRDLQPGARRAAARTRRRSPPRSRSGRRSCASPKLNAQLAADRAGAAATSTNNTAARAGIDQLTTSTNDQLGPDAQVHRPGADGLQLRRRCSSATSPSLVSERRRHRHLAAVHRLRRPEGPEQRGQPVLRRPPTAAATGQELPARTTRTRTPRRPGQTARVRGGQRALHRRPAGDRQRRPATRAPTREDQPMSS